MDFRPPQRLWDPVKVLCGDYAGPQPVQGKRLHQCVYTCDSTQQCGHRLSKDDTETAIKICHSLSILPMKAVRPRDIDNALKYILCSGIHRKDPCYQTHRARCFERFERAEAAPSIPQQPSSIQNGIVYFDRDITFNTRDVDAISAATQWQQYGEAWARYKDQGIKSIGFAPWPVSSLARIDVTRSSVLDFYFKALCTLNPDNVAKNEITASDLQRARTIIKNERSRWESFILSQERGHVKARSELSGMRVQTARSLRTVIRALKHLDDGVIEPILNMKLNSEHSVPRPDYQCKFM